MHITEDRQWISAASAYRDALSVRRILTILPNALVDKALSSESWTIGVQLITDGQPRAVHADRITMYVGTYSTQTILQHSGIGRADLMRALGVAGVAN